MFDSWHYESRREDLDGLAPSEVRGFERTAWDLIADALTDWDDSTVMEEQARLMALPIGELLDVLPEPARTAFDASLDLLIEREAEDLATESAIARHEARQDWR